MGFVISYNKNQFAVIYHTIETTPSRIQSTSLAVTIGYNIDHFGVAQAGYIL